METLQKVEFRRKAKDPLPLLILFGVTVQDKVVSCEAHYMRARTKRPLTVSSGKLNLKLPVMWPGFEIAPVEFNRG